MRNKKKETAMSISDIRSRLVNYKPQNPCSHCGSKWHSIFMCNEYHNLYYINYEPLPKFYRKANSDQANNVSHEHASLNLNLIKQILIVMLLMEFTGKRKLLLQMII